MHGAQTKLADPRSSMSALIDRMRELRGPDRQIDGELWLLDNEITNGDQLTAAQRARHVETFAPNFTGSYDAAIELLPKIDQRERGLWWCIQQTGGSHGSGKDFCMARIQTYDHGDANEYVGFGIGPIALCVALLRLRTTDIEER